MDKEIIQWEYVTDTFYPHGNDLAGWLNAYGEQGWEVIHTYFNSSNVSYHDEYYRFIFKRQIINNGK